MKMKEKKNNVISNVMYMLGILWNESRFYVFLTFFKETGEGIFWTFFSVYMTEFIYTSIENNTPFATVAAFVGAMCIGHIIIHIISATHQYMARYLTPDIYRGFYRRVINKALSMEYTKFEEPDFYDKYTRALNECRDKGNTILMLCAYFTSSAASMISAAWVVAAVDIRLLVFIIPMVAISLLFGKKTSDLYYQLDFSNTRSGRVGNYAKRVFYEKQYAGELRLFRIADLLLKRHEQAFEEMQERTRQIRRKTALFETVKWVVFNLLSFTLPYLYLALIIDGRTDGIGAYIAMIPGLSYLSWNVSDIVEISVELGKQSNFVNNLRDFLSYRPKTAKAVKPAPPLGDIEIKDMSFTYSGAAKPTLSDVNMTIRKGEKVAVVGHNGAGKTTLVKLIMGLYESTEGEIKISGENINLYEPKSFHKRFGTVFQDLRIFALPLAQNVLMHSPKNEEERRLVEESLRKAQFGDKLDTLEKGIDTQVTKEFDEKGMGLSGGEAQKIAIARVFASSPDIVILDEPSSALDPIAEYNMYRNMLTAAEGETVIFISHRLSATRDADRIYMFEHGRIIEQGSHKELLKLNGKYAEMWNLQASAYREETMT